MVNGMERDYIKALDEYFCEQYRDYVKLTAIEGYTMPEVITVRSDGNIERKDSEVMRLCRQANKEELLKTFKRGLGDTEFTFNFRFRTFRERMRDLRKKETFARLLPAALARVNETTESAGEKLDLSSKVWQQIVKGRVYPEKNTVVALALVTNLQRADFEKLMSVLGFSFSKESVRDIVCEYILQNQITNAQMRKNCLSEYHITSLPVKD